MSAALGWLAALLALALGARAGEVDEWLERLAAAEARGPAAGEAIAREGPALGPAAAEAALLGGGERFAALGLGARRARTWLLLTAGDERCIEPALGLLSDPDPEVRTGALAFLSGPELRDASIEPRAAALARLAEDSTDRAAVAGALAALARIDHPRTTAELARLMGILPAPERQLAARSLAGEPRARELVVATVQRAFEGGGAARVPDDVLAELVLAYGPRLAELPQGGTARRDRVPFVLGPRHPDPDVRRMAGLALERFVARARELGEVERAASVLRALVGAGAFDAELYERIARLVLGEAADPGPALEAARALRRSTDAARGDIEARWWHAVSGVLEGAALIALGRGEDSRAPLEAAERTLLGLSAERLDLSGSLRLARIAGGVFETLAVIDTYRALEGLAAGLAVDDPRVLEHARAAHEHALEAHLAVLEGELPLRDEDNLDSVLQHALGPLVLVLRNPRNAHLPPGRALDLELALCAALASAAPAELPGFARVTSLEGRQTDPLQDPARGALLDLIQEAYYAMWGRVIDKEIERFAPDDPRRGAVHWRLAQELETRKERDKTEPDRARRRLRTQGRLAILVAAHLREDGRFAEARALAERVIEDLRTSEDLRPVFVDYSRELLEAQAHLAVGNAQMDAEQAQAAEQTILLALSRFEKLEQAMLDQGSSPQDLAEARLWQADALVSLAVNANVKQGQPAKALAYFERAHALHRDDFMQVLLACYRARAGRAAEAREALRDTPLIPGNYYNLACTYALLGDADTALDFLRRDLDEKGAGTGALTRQKEWARADPDLASLRGSPRFEALVGGG